MQKVFLLFEPGAQRPTVNFAVRVAGRCDTSMGYLRLPCLPRNTSPVPCAYWQRSGRIRQYSNVASIVRAPRRLDRERRLYYDEGTDVLSESLTDRYNDCFISPLFIIGSELHTPPPKHYQCHQLPSQSKRPAQCYDYPPPSPLHNRISLQLIVHFAFRQSCLVLASPLLNDVFNECLTSFV